VSWRGQVLTTPYVLEHWCGQLEVYEMGILAMR